MLGSLYLVPPTVNFFLINGEETSIMLLSHNKIKMAATTHPNPPVGPRIGGSEGKRALQSQYIDMHTVNTAERSCAAL